MMIIIITIMALDFPDLNFPYGHYPKQSHKSLETERDCFRNAFVDISRY